MFVVPPTHCVTLIRDCSDRGLIARVSVLVCHVINRDSLPHVIWSILPAWSPSSFMRLCRPSSVSVGYTPSGDRGSGADGQPWFWSTHGRTESSGLRSGCTAAPNNKREPRWVFVSVFGVCLLWLRYYAFYLGFTLGLQRTSAILVSPSCGFCSQMPQLLR